MPIQYIQGYWYYGKITLKVVPPVFIPRIESHDIVHLCEKTLKNQKLLDQKRISFLEIGPGTGAISCYLLYRNKNMEGKAVEIYKKAYDLTKENAIRILGDNYSNKFQVKHNNFEN